MPIFTRELNNNRNFHKNINQSILSVHTQILNMVLYNSKKKNAKEALLSKGACLQIDAKPEISGQHVGKGL